MGWHRADLRDLTAREWLFAGGSIAATVLLGFGLYFLFGVRVAPSSSAKVSVRLAAKDDARALLSGYDFSKDFVAFRSDGFVAEPPLDWKLAAEAITSSVVEQYVGHRGRPVTATHYKGDPIAADVLRRTPVYAHARAVRPNDSQVVVVTLLPIEGKIVLLETSLLADSNTQLPALRLGREFVLPIVPAADAALVIYAGQTDPTDPAAFVVPFDYGAKRGALRVTFDSVGRPVYASDLGKIIDVRDGETTTPSLVLDGTDGIGVMPMTRGMREVIQRLDR